MSLREKSSHLHWSMTANLKSIVHLFKQLLSEETSEVAPILDNLAMLYQEENKDAIDLFLSLLEPILQDIEDPLPVYVGIIILGAAMTIVVISLLRLNWERILGRIAPWTLEDDDNNNQN